MMGYGYGGMMGGWGWLGFVFGLVLLIDSILAGVWLWQQIRKNNQR